MWFKNETPVADKRFATSNVTVLPKINSLTCFIDRVGARHSNWFIKRAQINSIGVFNENENRFSLLKTKNRWEIMLSKRKSNGNFPIRYGNFQLNSIVSWSNARSRTVWWFNLLQCSFSEKCRATINCWVCWISSSSPSFRIQINKF